MRNELPHRLKPRVRRFAVSDLAQRRPRHAGQLGQLMNLGHRHPRECGPHILGAWDSVLHAATVPQAVRRAQPLSVQRPSYRSRVPTTDPKTYLWENICALMRADDPSLDRAAKACKVGRGAVQRIKERDAATRLSSLQSIAGAFGIEVWQLLTPGLDPDSLPHLTTDPDSLAARLARVEMATRAPADFHLLTQAAGDFAKAVRARVLAGDRQDYEIDQAVSDRLKALFHLAGIEWPAGQPSPQVLPAETQPS